MLIVAFVGIVVNLLLVNLPATPQLAHANRESIDIRANWPVPPHRPRPAHRHSTRHHRHRPRPRAPITSLLVARACSGPSTVCSRTPAVELTAEAHQP
jgi:hypothetical protein